MTDTSISLPEDAQAELRRHLGLAPDEQPRISYVAGPGDVAGTYRYWSRGEDDPRVPAVAYSYQFYDLVDRLDASAQIVTVQDPGPEDARFRFDRVDAPKWTTRREYFAAQRTLGRQVEAVVRAFDPHVVVVATGHPTSALRSLARGRMLVLSVHNTFWLMGSDRAGPKERLKRMALAFHLRAVDAAVCTSDECARQLHRLTRGRIEGRVEFPQIARRYDRRAPDRIRNLLYLGRIEARKGIFLLLDAFVDLKARHPDLTLTFAGEGSDEQALVDGIAQCDVADVDYRGKLGSDGVHDAIRAADLVVCPTLRSFNEGLALVAFEAAAHDVPTLMSSVVPARELLGPGCRVFEAGNKDSLIAEADRLIDDPEAFRALGDALDRISPKLYERGLSWGSQLYKAMMQLR